MSAVQNWRIVVKSYFIVRFAAVSFLFTCNLFLMDMYIMTHKAHAQESNPLLIMDGLPRFDLIKPEHVVPAVRQVIQQGEKKIEDLEKNHTPTWDGLFKPMEDFMHLYERTIGPVYHLMGVKNSPELRDAYQTIRADIVAINLRLQQSKPLYKGMITLSNSDEWNHLEEAQKRIIKEKILDAEHSGIGLEGKEKDRFNKNVDDMSRISNDFRNNVLDAVKAFELIITDAHDTDGWPETLKNLAAQSYNQAHSESGTKAEPDTGPWRITLDYPSFGPFMKHSRQRDQREHLYRAFITRAAGTYDNSDLIEELLKLRKEQAELLGYTTFAEMSLSSKMAPDVSAVDDMFEELQKAAQPYAVKDYEDVRMFASNSGQTEPLEHWDVSFWSERLREERYAYTDEEVRPYFPVDRVLDGLFGLSQKLFSVTIEPADGDTPVWHPDTRFFKVREKDGRHIASFYLDPYSRPEEKSGGAWAGTCQNRRWIDDKLQLPVNYLICNGTPPVGDIPSLMSFREVETLFHEFGHGLQNMLTTVDYAEAAGLNGIEWDAVELASQFMENWCYHKPTLTGMTAHHETGEPLPDDMFDKIKASRTYQAGSFSMRQLEFAMTDMYLHHQYVSGGDETAFDVHSRIANRMRVLPPLEEERFLCAFTHIFAGGYAAGYYSYSWAEVLSADAFAAFEEAGLDNEDAVTVLGKRYRDTILALGGSRHPMDVFRDFRGRAPTTEALLRHKGFK